MEYTKIMSRLNNIELQYKFYYSSKLKIMRNFLHRELKKFNLEDFAHKYYLKSVLYRYVRIIQLIQSELDVRMDYVENFL